ncbi:MAG TPA: TIGR04563 family protein [Kofleriaceae bacterium]
MASSDKRKQSLYFPEEMLKEIQTEGARLDRSLSWIVQHAWKFARTQLKEFPSSTDSDESVSLPDPREE